jgi:hypothetical protein
MRTLVSRIAFHRKGARRASICSSMSGDIGVDAGDPAEHGREQELGRVGEIPVERSGPTCCFTWIGGVDLIRIHGRPRSDRREDSSSRLWRLARALGTHAKQGPSAGHRAEGLRQAGKCLLTPRPQFTAHHARLVTRWFVRLAAMSGGSVGEGTTAGNGPAPRRVSLFCFFPTLQMPAATRPI